jgi:phosphonate transport system ATP-binding protein
MLIKITSLTKRFGRSTAVDDASILIDRPQMIGIIGRSGAVRAKSGSTGSMC